MSTNIRTQILELLTTQRANTVEQMSRALQVTQADIRHHIGNLQQEGLVLQAGVRSRQGRGRPSKVYRLAAAARENNFVGLGKALLEVNRSSNSASGLEIMARHLAGDPVDNELTAPARRFFAAIQRLNELYYHARWEAHSESPRILLGNCPYLELVGEYPELCQMDAALLHRLTGLPATQIAKLDPNPMGAVHCVFRLEVRRRDHQGKENLK